MLFNCCWIKFCVGEENDDDDVTDVIEQIDCGLPPSFNDFGSYLIGVVIMVETCLALVGVIGVLVTVDSEDES